MSTIPMVCWGSDKFNSDPVQDPVMAFRSSTTSLNMNGTLVFNTLAATKRNNANITLAL